MNLSQTASPTERKPLRLWPGVLAVALQWVARFVVPAVVPAENVPDATMLGVLAALVFGLVVIAWWAFFSRAPGSERWGAIVLMVVALFVTRLLVHESVATGMMGFLLFIYAIPVVSLALVAWAVITRNVTGGSRRVSLVATLLLACAGWTLVRTGGITGYGDSDFDWRWAETAEDRLLAAGEDELPAVAPDSGTLATEAEWPGFRGPGRDGVVRGVRIDTDWAASPPVQLWRRPVGPGWSSFAVSGDLMVTQEQRGDDELVACYDVNTGEPVWWHRDAARFWESNAGAGPRATPTLHGGRVYTLGGTGIVNALDARDGAVVWSRDAAADTGAKTPEWGFSGSPLVTGDVVVVAAGSALVCYDIATGEPRWFGPRDPEDVESYSSPHIYSTGGVAQILLASMVGLTSVSATDGALLWQHAWSGYPIVQPALTADGDVLISVNERSGTRRLAVAQESGAWTVETRWTSIRLKPYFNDFVVHEGHAYGLDQGILACIDARDGKRKWKGGRYGYGQLVLLPQQDLLLVLSEEGELALARATPDAYTELARSPGIEGKTWNHPVLARDVLLVRNSEEMAAFRLTLVGE